MVTDSATRATPEGLRLGSHHNLVLHIDGECKMNRFYAFWNALVISHPSK